MATIAKSARAIERITPRFSLQNPAMRRNLEGWLFASPWILGFILWTLGPMIASLAIAFTEWDLIGTPRWVGLANIRAMINDNLVAQALKVTTLYAVVSVPLHLIFGLGLALLLNAKIVGLRFYRTAFYLPSVLSGVAVALLWRWLFSGEFGLLNALLASIGIEGPSWLGDPQWALPSLIGMSLWSVGAGAIIYLAGLQGIPTDLYEAAEVDGATGWSRFWNITLPMMTPVLFFQLLTGIIGALQVFTQAFIMTQGGPNNATLFFLLYLYQNAFLQTLMAAGTPADIYRYLQEVTPIIRVHESKIHLQLDDYITRDSYDIDDFRPDAVKLYQWEGATYALPRDYGNQNLFYNLDLLDAAGLEKPTVDWEDTSFTFEKFLEIAQALTKKSGDTTEQWGFLINRGQRPWASWLYNNGGALVHRDDRGVATDSALTDEASVEALQFLQDLMYTHEVAPRPDLESELGGFDLFASGRVGIMLNNPSSVNQYRTIEAFQWDIGTLPIGKAERRGTGGGGTGWAAAAATKFPDMAWKFLAYIANAQAELDEVAVGATTPARLSVVTSETFLDPTKPPTSVQGFAQAQEYVVRDPVHVRWPEITQRIYTPKMDLLWGGTETAATVAQMIKDEADPLFAE